MKHPIFTGSGVAIVTPFNRESVDLNALAKLLDFQLAHNTDAIIVCGTTGEAATMTYRERMRAIEFCVEHIDGRIPVIAGSGSNSTENAIMLSRDAEHAGSDGLLVVTPYYNKASQRGLFRHYNAIADSVGIPIILYNVPARTGVSISPDTYVTLSEHPNIQGVKEASGDLGMIQRTRALCPEDFFIWSGNDEETAAICLLGGIGVISVAANIVPAEIRRLSHLCLAGNFTEAGRLQIQLKALCDALFCEVNPIPVKTALNLMGWNAGDLRLPLCPPSEENLHHIRQTLNRYGLLPSDE